MLPCTPLHAQVFSQTSAVNTSLTGGTDGALASETPTTPADLKIILSGKFLEASQVLDGMLSPGWLAFHTAPTVYPACHSKHRLCPNLHHLCSLSMHLLLGLPFCKLAHKVTLE